LTRRFDLISDLGVQIKLPKKQAKEGLANNTQSRPRYNLPVQRLEKAPSPTKPNHNLTPVTGLRRRQNGPAIARSW